MDTSRNIPLVLLEQVVINIYITICQQYPYIIRADLTNSNYIPPDDIDYLDFSLLVDFTVKCLLIKQNTLPPNENINISKLPKRIDDFFEYMVYVYEQCSKVKYINIKKCKIFWNIYRVMKTIIYLNKKSPWNLNKYPNYLVNVLYNYNTFCSTVGGIKYSIYKDFYLEKESVYSCSAVLQPQAVIISNVTLLSINITDYSFDIAIEILNKLPNRYNCIERKWESILSSFITHYINKRYYPPNHPLKILSQNNTKGTFNKKLILFRSYFKLNTIHL